MANQDPWSRHAQRDGTLNEWPSGQGADLAMNQPSDRHPAGEPEDHDDERGARLPQRGEQQQQYHPRQGESEIGESEQYQPRATLPEPCRRANSKTDDY